MLHLLKYERVTEIIWNTSARNVYLFFPFIYSITYLYQYGLMDIYFVVWVMY